MHQLKGIAPANLDRLVLALLAVVATAVAVSIGPVWDDGWLRLTERQHGPAGILERMGDRQIIGWVWSVLARNGLLWTGSAVLHFVGWLAAGLIAYELVRGRDRSAAPLALSAGCLTMAPVLTDAGQVLVNLVWGALLSTVLVWGAVLLVDGRPARGSRGWRAMGMRRFAAALAVVLAAALSEYALAAALAGGAFLVVRPPPRSGGRRASWIDPGVLLAAAGVGFLIFRMVAEPGARPGTSAASLSFERPVAVAAAWAQALWHGALGIWLERLGTVQVVAKKACLAGGAAALALVLLARRHAEAPRQPAGGTLGSPLDRRSLALLAAVAAGMLPVILMGRTPIAGSRFWLPVLPAAAAFVVIFAAAVARSRLRYWIVAVAGFLAGSTLWIAAEAGWDNLARYRAWSEQIRPQVADTGLVLVMIASEDWSYHGAKVPADAELTAQITADWPAEMRSRVWVTIDRPYFWAYRQIEGVGRDRLEPDASFVGTVRGTGPAGSISSLLWCDVSGARTLTIRRLDQAAPAPPPSATPLP